MTFWSEPSPGSGYMLVCGHDVQSASASATHGPVVQVTGTEAVGDEMMDSFTDGTSTSICAHLVRVLGWGWGESPATLAPSSDVLLSILVVLLLRRHTQGHRNQPEIGKTRVMMTASHTHSIIHPSK